MSSSSALFFSSIHPQGWVPIETLSSNRGLGSAISLRSIHPQGWVPIETPPPSANAPQKRQVAFTPKGGCPLKPRLVYSPHATTSIPVAFTPKGGCPLKQRNPPGCVNTTWSCSIHPQGWVPIETDLLHRHAQGLLGVAFTPKGGCPLKPAHTAWDTAACPAVAFTPKGGCPLKRTLYSASSAKACSA